MMAQRRPIKPDADDRVRASKALERRLSGATYASIATEMGYASEAGPRNAIDRMLGRIEAEGVAQLRQLESMKLDALQSACWEQAVAGDLDAIKTLLQVHAARVKLLGLAAPVAVDVSMRQRSPGEILEDYKRELLASLDGR
jgi:hypothetical protein